MMTILSHHQSKRLHPATSAEPDSKIQHSAEPSSSALLYSYLGHSTGPSTRPSAGSATQRPEHCAAQRLKQKKSMSVTKTSLLASLALACLGSVLVSASAMAASQCETVRFTDPGWTDINATNGLASVVLKGLGYKTEVSTLAVPIGFEGLKNNEIDVFLGNWMPAQQTFIDKYQKTGDIDLVGVNLTGAKFTLAVPKYVHAAGVHDFSDLVKAKDKFRQRIYGIEAGAPANQLLQDMLDAEDFGLKKWRLVESGEQGVLSQVKRSIKRNEYIAFLAWEPHPMNSNFDLAYLTGGDKYFGANFGGATIQTLTRKNYSTECPNVGKLLKNMTFSLTMENQVMGYILDDGLSAEEAASRWLQQNPAVLGPWLKDITTLKGESGLAAVKQKLML